MADVHKPAIRSKNMRAIAAKDTMIEKRVAGLLNLLEITFHMHDAALAGRPDFVLDHYHCVIFTHGCFWHKHQCALFKAPATRTDFWLNKINGNVARDQRNILRLQRDDWRVMVIWECALRGRYKLSDQALYDRLEEWICAGDNYIEIDPSGLQTKENYSLLL